jgi:hypothetical protein
LLTIEGCDSEPVEPVADIEVEIDASPNVARPQKNLGFDVRVVNEGDAVAESVMATIQLPPALHLGDAPSVCTLAGQGAVCALGDLPPGATVTLPFSGSVDMGATGELAAFANVSTTSPDANAGNDAASLVVPLSTQSDIAASAYILPKGGLDAILTVSASNRGPAHAEAVKLRAQLPGGFELLEVPAGCSMSGVTLACDIPGLNPGRTKAYLLPVRRLPNAVGPFVAIVFASSSTSDHNSDNNTYTLEVDDLEP